MDVEDKIQLTTVTKKARLCVSVVSYHHVGPLVIEACIESVTDYIDTWVNLQPRVSIYFNSTDSIYLYSAGTIPRIRQWIDEYHRAAELAGVVVSHIFTFALPQLC